MGVIYIQKGIELLVLEFDVSGQAGESTLHHPSAPRLTPKNLHLQAGSVLLWLSYLPFSFTSWSVRQRSLSVVSVGLPTFLAEASSPTRIAAFWARKFIQDYAFAAMIILFTGFVHMCEFSHSGSTAHPLTTSATSPGQIKSAPIEFLDITKTFAPSTDRNWVVPFWELPVRWVFASLPFGLLITLLFYFDNNVSAVMAQARQFPVKRPAGFHFDFFLLGCTTFVSGVLGLPAPNGLVPQAPVHTEALCVTKMVPEEVVLSEGGYYEKEVDDRREQREGSGKMKVVRTRLAEQRVSHLVMGVSRDPLKVHCTG